MGGGALVTMIFIVYASFQFKDKQESNFKKYISENENLLTEQHLIIAENDSLALSSLHGENVVLVFWASWSEKSASMMEELDKLTSDSDVKVVAAAVKDATETVDDVLPDHDFLFIDGAKLFNDLKVPGIPCYILIDADGKVIDVTVGYRSGVADKIKASFSK